MNFWKSSRETPARRPQDDTSGSGALRLTLNSLHLLANKLMNARNKHRNAASPLPNPGFWPVPKVRFIRRQDQWASTKLPSMENVQQSFHKGQSSLTEISIAEAKPWETGERTNLLHFCRHKSEGQIISWLSCHSLVQQFGIPSLSLLRRQTQAFSLPGWDSKWLELIRPW